MWFSAKPRGVVTFDRSRVIAVADLAASAVAHVDRDLERLWHMSGRRDDGLHVDAVADHQLQQAMTQHFASVGDGYGTHAGDLAHLTGQGAPGQQRLQVDVDDARSNLQPMSTRTQHEGSRSRARHDGRVRPSVIVVMGVTGAGKTTVGMLIAEHLGIPFVDADDFHDPDNIERMRGGEPLDDAARTPWLDRLNAQLREHAVTGVVLACSALKQSYRVRLTRGVDDVQFIVLSGPPDLLRARIEARTDHFAPATLLPSQIEALEIPVDAMVMGVTRPPEAIAASIIVSLGLA